MIKDQPIKQASGVTIAEKYLGQLCRKTFLSLWSYPEVYKDQGIRNGGHGKEVCDLLVVFGEHIIIFSDKDCVFPTTGDPDLDWSRWFRRAVIGSAQQLWSAERWIRLYPDRIFLDRACKARFPVPLPNLKTAKFHLILVAHNAAERCSQEFGGSGSFMFDSTLRGIIAHTEPFTVGDLDPNRSFVHILDDTALHVVMKKLDTISDFVAYFNKKEKLIRSGKPDILTTGEEELLAVYMKKINDQGEHDFIFPEKSDGVALGEGIWESFEKNDQRKRQIDADRISYFWDQLIETFNAHAIAGTQYFVSSGGFSDTEKLLRYMAGASRFKRRVLSQAFFGLLEKTPVNTRGIRYVQPSDQGDPHYVFLLLPIPKDASYQEYREYRQAMVGICCRMTKMRFPEANDIICVATEPGRHLEGEGSEDAAYFDGREFTAEEMIDMKSHYKDWGFTDEIRMVPQHFREYPDILPNPRNKPCFCGSEKKYKKCHGK